MLFQASESDWIKSVQKRKTDFVSPPYTMSSFSVWCTPISFYISNRRHFRIWGHIKYMGAFNAENFHHVHTMEMMKRKIHNTNRISKSFILNFIAKNPPFIVARTLKICILLWDVNSPFTVNSYLFWLVQTRQIPIPVVQILIRMKTPLHFPIVSLIGKQNTNYWINWKSKKWDMKRDEHWVFCVDKRCAYIGFSNFHLMSNNVGKFPCDRYYHTFLVSSEYWIAHVSGDSEIHSTQFSDGEFSIDLQF